MEIFLPELGLFVWTILAFGVFLFIMKKFAWKPLIGMLNDREQSIAEALSMAEKSRKEYAELELMQKKMIQEAEEERIKLIQEARSEKAQIIAEAKEEAIRNANRIVENAKQELLHERERAMSELKNEIAKFSIQIAELILKQKLDNDKAQQKLIDEYINDLRIN